MKNTAIACLVVLNALLLAGFLGRAGGTFSSDAGVAHAQARGARPGDYIMIPGELTAGSAAVIYVIDQTNGWLSAFAYDDANKRLEAMPGKIELEQVFRQGAGNAPAEGNVPANQGNNPRNRGGRGY
jgi:hypothetical protein